MKLAPQGILVLLIGCLPLLGESVERQVRDLNQQSFKASNAGDLSQAIAIMEKAVALTAAGDADRGRVYGTLQANLGYFYTRAGRFDDAREKYTRALAILEKSKGVPTSQIASCLLGLAQLDHRKGLNAEALPLAERAVTLYRGFSRKFSRELGISLVSLGSIQHRMGRFAEARRLLSEGVEILGTRDPQEAIAAYDALANLSWSSGDLATAERYFALIVETIEKTGGPDDPRLFGYWRSLGAVYRDSGESWRADPLFEKQRGICALGAAKIPYCAVDPKLRMDRADYYERKGDIGRAIPEYEQLGADIEAHGIPDKKTDMMRRNLYVMTLASLRNLYAAQGNLSDAIAVAQKDLAFSATESGPESSDTGGSLYILADLEAKAGDARAEEDYARAVPLLERYLKEIAGQAADSGNNLGYEVTARRLAVYYRSHGQLERADLLLSDSLRRQSDQYHSAGPDYAVALEWRARFAAQTQRTEAALKWIRDAISAKEAAGAASPLLVSTLTTAAEIAFQSKQNTDAYRWLERASRIEEANVDALLARGYEEEKRIALANHTRTLNLTISLAMADPGNAEFAALAGGLLLQRKGRAQEVSAMVYRSARLHAQGSDTIQQLSEIRGRIAHLILSRAAVAEGANAGDELRSLRLREETLEAELAKRGQGELSARAKVSAAEIRTALPQRSGAVEIIQYRGLQTDGTYAAPSYAAYVIDRLRPPVWVRLGDATALDRVIFSFRRSLHEARDDYREPARQLYSMVWDPIVKQLGDASSVYLCPDGELNLIPFGALTRGADRFVVEDYSLHYLTAARDLLRPRTTGNAGGNTVIVADPDYGGDTGSITDAAAGPRAGNLTLGFRRLPGTRQEAQAIREIMPEAVLRVDRDASESAIKAVHSPAILHIATHGFFLPSVWLATTASRGVVVAQGVESSYSGRWENPLVQSGLALAGANQLKSGEEDGILTALEASALDLSDTRLVVLSACDTGVGAVQNGQGVFGLRSALGLAGARNQMLSLWKVDDAATVELMTGFYRGLRDRKSPGEALRAVQIHSATAQQHPYYWAGFIVSGTD